MRDTLTQLVRAIPAHDALEAAQLDATVAWIASGASLFRLAQADDPPQHLVAYFMLFDPAARKVLLVDHKKAGLWLPNGGHVEPDEDPQMTVRREVREELGVEARFFSSTPLFLTICPTVGAVAPHVDVSLWYVLVADSTQSLWFDEAEFHQIAWFALDKLPLARSDPHLARFVAKLQMLIA